jgi:hypothetical protein
MNWVHSNNWICGPFILSLRFVFRFHRCARNKRGGGGDLNEKTWHRLLATKMYLEMFEKLQHEDSSLIFRHRVDCFTIFFCGKNCWQMYLENSLLFVVLGYGALGTYSDVQRVYSSSRTNEIPRLLPSGFCVNRDETVIRRISYSFRRVRITYKRLSSHNNSAPTGRISMKFDIWYFLENVSKKFEFHHNRTITMGTLHDDQCAFVIIFCSVLLRMTKFVEKIKTHILGSIFFKSFRLWNMEKKISYSRAGNRWRRMRIACRIP